MTTVSPRRTLSAYPKLVAEFHPTKNAPRTPKTVSYGGIAHIWWRCAKRHEWQDTPNHRTRGRNCPYCAGRRVDASNSLARRLPRIAKCWHPTKNGAFTPRDVTCGSDRLVWWFCPKSPDHVWQCGVGYRVTRGCPFCAGRRVCRSNSLATRRPRVAREWHPTKNKPLTPRAVVAGSERRAWWRCRVGHEWETSIAKRAVAGHGCPTCAGQRVTPATSLAVRVPGVLRFWHPTRNLPLTPAEVSPHSHRRVQWRCAVGSDHEWEGSVDVQARSGGRCPFCSSKRLSVTNSLATCYPRVAAQWHPTKNGTLTPRDILRAVSRKVWWLCSAGHEWAAIVANRTSKGCGCPVCSHIQAAKTRRDRNRLQRRR